jgi:hypothetical protein
MTPINFFWLTSAVSLALMVGSVTGLAIARVAHKATPVQTAIELPAKWGTAVGGIILFSSLAIFWACYFASIPFVGAIILLTVALQNTVYLAICFIASMFVVFCRNSMVAKGDNLQDRRPSGESLEYFSGALKGPKYSRSIWRICLWCVPILRAIALLKHARSPHFSSTLPYLLAISIITLLLVAITATRESWNPFLFLALFFCISLLIGDGIVAAVYQGITTGQ